MKRMQNFWTRARGVSPSAIDGIVAAALVFGAVAVAAGGKHHGPLTLLAGAVCCATVAWRRRAPAAAVTIAAVSIAVFAIASGNKNLTIEPLAALLDYYMLGRLAAERGQPRVDGALLALAVGAIVVSPGNPHVTDVAATWSLFVAVPFATGRAIGSRAALTRELRANAERLEREQEERAHRAAAEERNRIAREIHDVVAHGVSVMVIQTQAARRIAPSDPEAARAALDSVQTCGRDALIEMRRMIGVLRHGDEELAGPTAPALSELDALVSRARAAGLPVELRIEGEPHELAPALDLVAFRIIQEALTNVIKHAGPARALVRLAFTGDVLDIEISDTGVGPARAGESAQGGGQGLVGMRERLSLYGGELRTGRGRGGGFRVRVRLPLREPVAA